MNKDTEPYLDWADEVERISDAINIRESQRKDKIALASQYILDNSTQIFNCDIAIAQLDAKIASERRSLNNPWLNRSHGYRFNGPPQGNRSLVNVSEATYFPSLPSPSRGVSLGDFLAKASQSKKDNNSTSGEKSKKSGSRTKAAS